MEIYLRNGNLRKGKKPHYVAVVRERSEGKKLWLQEQRRRSGESSWVGSWQLAAGQGRPPEQVVVLPVKYLSNALV